MKSLLALTLATACAVSTLSVPQLALAQPGGDYGYGDVCAAKKKQSTTTGTVAGGALGALAGAALAGKDDRGKGAIIGGLIGAGVGHQVGKHNVNCAPYPNRISQSSYSRNNCRWIQEYYDGRDHSLEVCRSKDGVWRPSGRA